MKKNNKKISLPKYKLGGDYTYEAWLKSQSKPLNVDTYATDPGFSKTASATKFNAEKKVFDATKPGTQPKANPSVNVGAIGDAVGMIGAGLETSENKKTAYWGKVAKGAGTGASMGAAVGSIIPGWGTAVGAAAGGLIGGGISLASAEKDRKNGLGEDFEKAAARNAFDIANMNSAIVNSYNMNSNENDRLPMANKGMSRFSSAGKNFIKPNAMLAKGETTVDGATGVVSNVPGKYNKQNPDTVMANLTENTTIHSMHPDFIVPGGSSTTAQIMKNTIPFQKKAIKYLSTPSKFAPIDISTAKLNNANIKAVDTQLAEFGDKVRAKNNPEDNKFDLGGTLTDIASIAAQTVPAFVNMSATPETVQTPIYADYLNTNRRYDISNQMNDVDGSSAMAKYNYSNVNRNSGIGASMASDLYAKKQQLKSSIYNSAEEANYKYQKDYNIVANTAMDVRRGQYEQYLDKVDKTKANANTIKSEGMKQLSTAIQGTALNQNKKAEQAFNAMQWASIAKDLPTDQREQLFNQIMALNGTNRSVTIPSWKKKEKTNKKQTSKKEVAK